MSNYLLLFTMFCGGMAVAIQPSINARLAQKIGAFESSFISFAVGTFAMLLVVMFTGRGSLKALGATTWWELTGGLLGAFFVTLTIVTVPRIGTVAVMAGVIAGQLATGAILDHYGLFGFQQVPLEPKRMFGIVLLAAGAALVLRK
jgi:transporter family-2 protein